MPNIWHASLSECRVPILYYRRPSIRIPISESLPRRTRQPTKVNLQRYRLQKNWSPCRVGRQYCEYRSIPHPLPTSRRQASLSTFSFYIIHDGRAPVMPEVMTQANMLLSLYCTKEMLGTQKLSSLIDMPTLTQRK